MKTLKKIALAVMGFFILSAVGGYLYFNHKFSPPPNYLQIKGTAVSLPVTWIENQYSPIAALLLPVTFPGVPHQFYMQFDLGSHSTLFYKASLGSINARYPNQVPAMDSARGTTSQTFNLGNMKISSEEFRVLNYGNPVNWDTPEVLNIIGTIGADLVEQKITAIDFRQGTCYFGDSIPPTEHEVEFVDFEFKERRILIPAEIRGKEYKLLYDSGTSAFELVTSKKQWNALAGTGAEVIKSKANSAGRTLTTFTTRSEGFVHFPPVKIRLNEVTYIEGTSPGQYWMMRLTGMGGMIGNKLFKDHMILIDCRNERFGIGKNR